MSIQISVILIDDESVIVNALSYLFRSRGLIAKTYTSAKDFVTAIDKGAVNTTALCVIVSDMRMPEMNGVELFDALKSRGLTERWPVIFLTGHADVPMAVAAIKKGAVDFFEKPFNDNELVDRVIAAAQASAAQIQPLIEMQKLKQRLAELTKREREVM